MVEVKQKDSESFESMLRRFKRKVQQSGILVRARKNRFFEKEPSDNLKKRSALRRAEMAERREDLKRQGKLGRFRR